MFKTRKNHRILVVDDDSMNVEIIEEILGDTYILRATNSGEKAIEIAESFRPDLILLDIMMSGVDGYEVCRRIRSNPNLSLTKIILVSAKQMLKDRLDGYNAGADEYITKPFDPDELRAKVVVFLRLKFVEEVEQTKSNLISIFSHETKTPLHAIIGFANLLQSNQNLSTSDYEAIDYIIKSSRQLLELIEKTILLADLRTNAQLKMDIVDLLKCLQALKKHISLEFDYLDFSILYDSSEKQILISGNFDMLIMAFSCLIASFSKLHTDSVKISVECYRDKENSSAILKFSAAGTQVSLKKIDTLFDDYQVEDVLHHGGGHGVGLALLKHIIEIHEGTVFVFNDPKECFSCFKITLPLLK